MCALALASCSVLNAYPTPSAEVCDGMRGDEDLDGLVDCADPDCDGQCPEEGERCLDGRDNDQDGLVDALDSRCWTSASVSIDRCAPIHASDVTLAPILGSAWNGDGTPALDPEQPGAPALRGAGVLTSRETFSGAWVGTHLTARAYLAGGAAIELRLRYAAGTFDVLRISAESPSLGLPEGVQAKWGMDDAVFGLLDGPAVDGWRTLTLDVRSGPGGALVAAVRSELPDGRTVEAQASSAPDWPVADALSLEVVLQTVDPSSVALLGAVHVTRDAIDPCPSPVADVPHVADSLLHLADGSWCMTGYANDGSVAAFAIARSSDGVAWTVTPSSYAGWLPESAVRDPLSDELLAIGGGPGEPLRIARGSADCQTWTDVGVATDDPRLMDWTSAALFARTDAHRVTTYEIWAYRVHDALPGGGAQAELVVATSSTGAPMSFTVIGTRAVPMGLASFDAGEALPIRITQVGDDHVLIGSSPPDPNARSLGASVGLWVQSGDAWRSLGVRLAQSDIPGRFDQRCVSRAFLAMDAAPTGGALHGLLVARCDDTDSVLLPFVAQGSSLGGLMP